MDEDDRECLCLNNNFNGYHIMASYQLSILLIRPEVSGIIGGFVLLLFQQKPRNLVLCLAGMMWQWIGMVLSECDKFIFIQLATHNDDTAAIVGIPVAGMAGQNEFYGAVVDSHADQVHCVIESEGNSCSSYLLLI